MTFRIERDGPRPGGAYERDVWLVEKILSPGERLLLASFEESGPAVAMLAMLGASCEVKRGAKLEFDRFTINAEAG